MKTKWYQKATVQSAIIGGIFVVFAALIPLLFKTVKKEKNEGQKVRTEVVIESLSFEEYYKKIDDLKDRFFEKEEFIKELKGKKVIWEGYVSRVSSNEDGSMTLTFKVVKDETFNFALVDFEKNWKTKLFSLRKNDKIKVHAIFKEEKIRSPWLEGISLELLD